MIDPRPGFRDKEHKERFLQAVRITGKLSDREYCCALYVLTSDLSIWSRAESYVSPTGTGIRFDDMLHEIRWSSAIKALLCFTANLFNGVTRSDPIHLMQLDETHFRIAQECLRIRYYGVIESDLVL